MDTRIINRGRGPEIEGTRITVYDVWDYVRLGWHQTEIAALFRLSSDQIRAATEFIDQHREDVLASYQSMVDRHHRHQYSPEVQEKLAQARAKLAARKAEIDSARQAEAAHAGDHGRQ
jgi:uncharacterized protein (DUF433 family)